MFMYMEPETEGTQRKKRGSSDCAILSTLRVFFLSSPQRQEEKKARSLDKVDVSSRHNNEEVQQCYETGNEK